MLQCTLSLYLILTLIEKVTTVDYQHVFISKVEPTMVPNKNYNSHCYNTTAADSEEYEVDCRCYGKALLEIPDDLDPNVRRITITDSNMQLIKRDSFQPYRDTLRDV